MTSTTPDEPASVSEALARLDAVVNEHQRLLDILYRDVPPEARRDVQFFDKMYKLHGPFRSTAGFDDSSKLDARLHFHHKEKAEVSLTAASSWYGGDFFEFGSSDLNTFRNMLTAFDICGLEERFPDTRFYGFDIFRSLNSTPPETKETLKETVSQTGHNQPFEYSSYFDQFMQWGDRYGDHIQYLRDHNLFEKNCILVQGLFQDTLSPEFKKELKSENREIGFAFLDCNRTPSYTLVFEFIYDLMAADSYIYMDEYFDNPDVIQYFEEFTMQLRTDRKIGTVYMRNAAGFGGLFRFYPLYPDLPPLSLTDR